MVRTRADGGGRRIVSAKAPRKSVGRSSGGGASGSAAASPSSSGNTGGNPVKWWPTPAWQKGISSFLKKNPSQQNTENENNNDSTGNTDPKGESSALGSNQEEKQSQTADENGAISSKKQEIVAMEVEKE